jgi:hypothetical protein
VALHRNPSFDESLHAEYAMKITTRMIGEALNLKKRKKGLL